MPSIQFTKAHALGNDFVIIEDADAQIDVSDELVRFICDRWRGVGADGLIRAVRSERLAAGRTCLEEEPEAEWFLDHRSPDGSTAPLSAGALRTLARFLTVRQLVRQERRDTLPIATPSGVRDVLQGVSGYTVDLGRWKLDTESLVAAEGLEVARPALGVWIGSPHLVTVLADAGELESLRLDRSPRVSGEAAPDASAVFVVAEDPLLKNGVGRIRMRSHVAGREPLTDANAAAAAALAFRHWGGPDMPHHWSVETHGGRTAVRMFATEEGEHIAVSGSVEIVFSGTVDTPE